MTAISRPPLAPLFADSDADFFASFALGSGSVFPQADSIVGLRSSDMTPRMAIGELATAPQQFASIGAFAAIPSAGLLIGRFSTAGTGLAIYRMDGRKRRSGTTGATGGPNLTCPYFNGRAIGRFGTTKLSTVDPISLATDSTDITFAPGGAVTSPASSILCCSDAVGNLFSLGILGGGSTFLFAKWNRSGALQWSNPLTFPGGQTATSPVQMECDASGDFYVALNWTTTGRKASLRRYSSATGALLWEQLWTASDPSGLPITISEFWISSTAIIVQRSNPQLAGSFHATQPMVESYTLAGALNWSMSPFPGTVLGSAVGGLCQVGPTVIAGTFPNSIGGGKTANIFAIDAGTGTLLNSYFVGATLCPPAWLEARRGRIGTFAQ